MQITVLGCLAGVLLAGCQGAASDSSNSDGKSPLAEYLGFSPLTGRLGTDGDIFAGAGRGVSDEEKSKQRKVEELVAKCMRQEGFEYVPRSPDKQEATEFDKAFSLDPEEFAKRYGYGISTMEHDPEAAKAAKAKDPNVKIVDALSPKAKEAYQRALYGKMPDLPEDGDPGGTIRLDPGNGGCFEQAETEVRGDTPDGPGTDGPDEFAGLFADLEALRKRFEREPQVVDATKKWSDCMAEAGYSGLDKLEDAPKLVRDRMSKASGDDSSSGHSSQPVADVDPKAREEIRSYELAVAGADYECQQSHLARVRDEVGRKLERQFVDAHRAELERFKEAGGLSGGHG